MIRPTVGRKVWYRPSMADLDTGMTVKGSEPLDATIVAVHSDRLVNLSVSDANGVPWTRTSVTLVQDLEPKQSEQYCEWMPFQATQARKAEKPTAEQLDNRYSYHSPKDDQPTRYGKIRWAVLQTAAEIVTHTPVSPEQARALDALDMAMMLANAAIARNE